MDRPQKITFAEMRSMGVRGLLIYCADYHCSHHTTNSGDRWADYVRLSDLEPRLSGVGPPFRAEIRATPATTRNAPAPRQRLWSASQSIAALDIGFDVCHILSNSLTATAKYYLPHFTSETTSYSGIQLKVKRARR